MGGTMDRVIQQGLDELERYRAQGVGDVERAYEATKHKLETLRQAGERDVFKDALVLAVGEVRGLRADVGWHVGLSMGGDMQGQLLVVESKLTEERRKAIVDELYKANAPNGPRPLRAMLVIFEDAPPKAVS